MERPGQLSRPTSNSRKPLRARKAWVKMFFSFSWLTSLDAAIARLEKAGACRLTKMRVIGVAAIARSAYTQTSHRQLPYHSELYHREETVVDNQRSPRRVPSTSVSQVPSNNLSNPGGRHWQSSTSPAAESTDAVTDFLSGHVPNHGMNLELDEAPADQYSRQENPGRAKLPNTDKATDVS